MKKLLVMCGTGIATSTIVMGKIRTWIEENGFLSRVTLQQGKISEEINRIDDYDIVISTTLVPDSIKNKVINGVSLITGVGTDQVFEEIKQKLEK